MEKTDTSIDGIFFMPYLDQQELDIIQYQLDQKESPEITLTARHEYKTIPSNVTSAEVLEIIPRYGLNNNHLYRLRVAVGEGEATIVLDYPEHQFTIEESNQEFNEVIISSFQEI